MATWTPETKNSSTFENENITGIADWADSVATWGADLFNWGGSTATFSNETKNSSTFINETKN